MEIPEEEAVVSRLPAVERAARGPFPAAGGGGDGGAAVPLAVALAPELGQLALPPWPQPGLGTRCVPWHQW